eukprot:1574975-Pleurochrysis_carterae.AAC.2
MRPSQSALRADGCLWACVADLVALGARVEQDARRDPMMRAQAARRDVRHDVARYFHSQRVQLAFCLQIVKLLVELQIEEARRRKCKKNRLAGLLRQRGRQQVVRAESRQRCAERVAGQHQPRPGTVLQ